MYPGALAGCGKTMLARENFDGLRVWNNGTRDWRDRRDTRNYGLRVALVALGLPVTRLSRWRTLSHPVREVAPHDGFGQGDCSWMDST
jgi:hypothetical protein